MIKAIILTCGYVEDQKTAVLTFLHTRKGFKTEEEALISLANDLKRKYLLDTKKTGCKTNECCRKSTKSERNFKYCGECGSLLSSKDSFDVEDFTDWIYQDFHGSTCDSYGASHIDTLELEWSPWEITEILNLKRNQILFIEENAERLLGIALLNPPPRVRQAIEKGIYSLGYV